jgi:membrane fusion protein (multidrug efflux system)
MKKKMLAGVVALVLIAGAYYLVTGHSDVGPAQAQMSARQRPPAEVTVETISPQALVLTQDLPGRTSAYQVAEIRPQVSGIIIDRLFAEGSLVKEGQQLYQIDPAAYQAAYDSTVAALRKTEANLKSVEPKLVRYQELVEVGGVSRQDYDDVVAQLEQAKADVAVAKAAVATAKINLNYTKVFAPISGRIGKSAVTRGALVTANQAAALATVQNLSKIYVDVSQSSAEMMKLRRQFLDDEQSKRMIAKLLLEGETQPYALDGEVQFSDVSVDEGTGMIQLRILFPNPDGYLLPGLFVKARIPQSKLEDAIVVPQQAVVRGAGGGTSVWLVGDGDKVAVQPVSTERALTDKWLISTGLQQGDRIVVSGLQKIAPGVQVAAVEATAVQ